MEMKRYRETILLKLLRLLPLHHYLYMELKIYFEDQTIIINYDLFSGKCKALVNNKYKEYISNDEIFTLLFGGMGSYIDYIHVNDMDCL